MQELLDLTKKLTERKINGTEQLRREELLWQLENAGIQSGAAELDKLKAIIDTTKDVLGKLPVECPQKTALESALLYYEKGIKTAIRGIAKIEENLYERYAEARNGGASHEEALLSKDEELLNKFRTRYELEKIQAQLNSTIRRIQVDADDDEDFWDLLEED